MYRVKLEFWNQHQSTPSGGSSSTIGSGQQQQTQPYHHPHRLHHQRHHHSNSNSIHNHSRDPIIPPPYKRTDEMGSSIQQYCLRWNNHRSNLLLVFEHLFQTEAFTDVTLACEGESIKCHKMVLAACSSYFQQLFMENTCRHPIVILKDIRESEIRAILEYMYKGEVNVAQDQLAGLLKAAETLKVKGLVEDNNQRTVPSNSSSTPPTPPHQSSASSPYHHHHSQPPPPPAQLQPTPLPLTTSNSSGSHQDQQQHYSYSCSANTTTTSYNHSKSNPLLPLPSTKFSIANNDSLYESSPSSLPYSNSNANTTTPERIERNSNALTFPAWSNKLSLSPKHGTSLNNATTMSNNISNMNNSFDNILQNEQPVPLKKKRFMTSSSSSSSVTTNKDTPILRTVLGHTASSQHSSAPNSSDSVQLKSINYSFTPTTIAAPTPPLTTNGPIDTNEQVRMDRDQDSPVDLFMDDSARSVDSDKGHDDNHSYNMECDDKKGLAMYVPSQKPEWKRYKQYTRNDIMAAIDAVRAGMSALQAARKFGVPSRTLYDKVKKLGITTNRPYRKGSFPMSPYQGMSMKDDNSSYSPEELPLDISSTGNGLGLMSGHGQDGDSDKMDSDPGSSIKRESSPPMDFKDDYIHEERAENGSGHCSSTSPRDRDQLEPEEVRSHSE